MAHEFWLEPSDFTPKVGSKITIAFYIGQHFKGDRFPYVREESKRFTVANARGEKPVKAVSGDDPAATLVFSEPGLQVLVHQSTSDPVTFDTWEEFENYLRMEGLDHIGPLHRAQGKPLTGIKETYFRCAKLLVSVGGDAGEDRALGLPLELVAERNPYRLAAGEDLPVRLLYNGQPIEGVQITAFSKAAPNDKQNVRTDAEGRARIALPMQGPWLLNAVHMIAPPAGEKAHWASLWASMTFARP